MFVYVEWGGAEGDADVQRYIFNPGCSCAVLLEAIAAQAGIDLGNAEAVFFSSFVCRLPGGSQKALAPGAGRGPQATLSLQPRARLSAGQGRGWRNTRFFFFLGLIGS